MKILAKIFSQLMSKDQITELKLKKQHYILIFPQHLIQKLGIIQNEISFELVIDNSNKLLLIGPELASQQPKSNVSTTPSKGDDDT